MRSAESPRRGSRRKRWIEQQSVFWYRLTRAVFWLLLHLWVRSFRTQGADRVPARGGMFLIANHTSGLDPFIIGLPVRQRMLRGPGKAELFKNPIVAWYMHKVGIFPLRREGVDAAAVRTIVELYRGGRMVIIYPEAGRAAPGKFKRFDPDFARLAIKLRAPLVPAGIAGAADVLPIGSLIPRPNTPLAVVYGEQFTLHEYYDRELTAEVLEEAAALMQDRVATLVEQARGLNTIAGERHP